MYFNRNKSMELKQAADALFKSGKDQASSQVLEQALEAAYCIVDGYEKAYALSECCTSLALQGQIERALDIGLAIELKDFKDFALSDICVILYQKGEIKKALGLLKKIEDGCIKEQTKEKIKNSP